MSFITKIRSNFFKDDEMRHWKYYKEPWDTSLRIMGFGVMHSDYETSKRRFFGYVNIFIMWYFGLSGIVTIFVNEWDFQIFCTIIMLTVVGSVIGVQMITLIYHKNSVRKLVADIETDWEVAVDPNENDILIRRARHGYYGLIALVFLISTAAFSFMINALCRKGKALPAPFFFIGFESWDFPFYQINFFLHMYTMNEASMCMTPFISYFVFSVMQMVAQLEILAYRMRKIGNEIIDEDEMLEILRYCYIKHLNIIERGKHITNIFEKFLLFQIFVSGSCISLAMYNMMSNESVFDNTEVNIFFGASVLHLFTFCWYGEVLTNGSLAFATDLYMSSWYLAPCSMQKDLVLMIQRAQVPICVSIGGVGQLRLETFTSVMKSAYSYCAVLSSVNE